ncbi:class IV adenylate cyclase [Nocardiopsis sp. NPDC006938]|uniref:class IV adenylate cyclase n=1 Tax=Nocardiopsis sp. NPDC006938 TaxID=3364337 RepID=UPI003688B455
MREIETKYRVGDTETLLAALKSAGVELGDVHLQDDLAYAPAGWGPEQGKVGYTFARLRTQDGDHVLTTKTPVANVMECVEYETGVEDREQTHCVLVALGYEPSVRIVKERRSGRSGDMAVCVDVVKGAGTFLELELVVDDDRDGVRAQSEMDAWAQRLGVALERTADTYDTLVRGGDVG